MLHTHCQSLCLEFCTSRPNFSKFAEINLIRVVKNFHQYFHSIKKITAHNQLNDRLMCRMPAGRRRCREAARSSSRQFVRHSNSLFEAVRNSWNFQLGSACTEEHGARTRRLEAHIELDGLKAAGDTGKPIKIQLVSLGEVQRPRIKASITSACSDRSVLGRLRNKRLIRSNAFFWNFPYFLGCAYVMRWMLYTGSVLFGTSQHRLPSSTRLVHPVLSSWEFGQRFHGCFSCVWI